MALNVNQTAVTAVQVAEAVVMLLQVEAHLQVVQVILHQFHHHKEITAVTDLQEHKLHHLTKQAVAAVVPEQQAVTVLVQLQVLAEQV